MRTYCILNIAWLPALPQALQGWQTVFLAIPCLLSIAAPSTVPVMLLGLATATATDWPVHMSDTFLLQRAAGIVTAALAVPLHDHGPFLFSSGGP